MKCEEFGRQLRHWRESRRLTQKQLADLIGYSTPQFISNWERGIAFPPRSYIKTLSKHLGVPVKTIVLGIFEARERILEDEKLEWLIGAVEGPQRRGPSER